MRKTESPGTQDTTTTIQPTSHGTHPPQAPTLPLCMYPSQKMHSAVANSAPTLTPTLTGVWTVGSGVPSLAAWRAITLAIKRNMACWVRLVVLYSGTS